MFVFFGVFVVVLFSFCSHKKIFFFLGFDSLGDRKVVGFWSKGRTIKCLNFWWGFHEMFKLVTMQFLMVGIKQKILFL